MSTPTYQLDDARAVRLAELALHGIDQEYPYSAHHMLTEASDRRSPRELHPAFFGCLDWHSAVHSHWLLVALLRRLPTLSTADAMRLALNEHLSDANLRIEAAYFQEPGRRSYERPYGWAWVLKLAETLHDWDDPDGAHWRRAMQPLVEVISESYLEFLPRLSYPIRSGMHNNTAFGLTFAFDYAVAVGHDSLRELIAQRSRDYFGNDRAYPANWEPDGSDFLSPCLIEADLMRRVLPTSAFATWLAGYLPELAQREPSALLNPALVSDRSDGQIVHLDGLNLSRAWCMWGIARTLAATDLRRPILLAAAERHAEAGLSGVGSGNYMGDHWLGSFALYMLLCAPSDIHSDIHDVGAR